MTFEVDIDGRTRVVVLERGKGAGEYRVTVDGHPHLVEAARPDEYTLVLGLAGSEKGTVPYSVHVTPGGGPGQVLVTLGTKTVTATVNGRRTGRVAESATHAHGEQSVVAPMPGRVVRVLVAAGDEVAARQGVVVVEAMKMENELRSPKAGRVKDVHVSPGTSVEAGRVLIVIE